MNGNLGRSKVDNGVVGMCFCWASSQLLQRLKHIRPEFLKSADFIQNIF